MVTGEACLRVWMSHASLGCLRVKPLLGEAFIGPLGLNFLPFWMLEVARSSLDCLLFSFCFLFDFLFSFTLLPMHLGLIAGIIILSHHSAYTSLSFVDTLSDTLRLSLLRSQVT